MDMTDFPPAPLKLNPESNLKSKPALSLALIQKFPLLDGNILFFLLVMQTQHFFCIL